MPEPVSKKPYDITIETPRLPCSRPRTKLRGGRRTQNLVRTRLSRTTETYHTYPACSIQATSSRRHLSNLESEVLWCSRRYAEGSGSLLEQEHPILYHTILYYTILYYTILYYTILYYTILYYTILYYTILYYTMLCYAMLY